MKLTIKMGLGNSAFRLDVEGDEHYDEDDYATLDYDAIEAAVVASIERAVGYQDRETPVIDLNGNTVGTLKIEPGGFND